MSFPSILEFTSHFLYSYSKFLQPSKSMMYPIPGMASTYLAFQGIIVPPQGLSLRSYPIYI